MTLSIGELAREYERDLLNPGRSVSRAWWITGDDTETDATASALLVTTAPTTDTDSGLPLVELKIRDVGRYQWKGFATYSSPTRSGGPVVNAIGEVAKAYSASARPERIFQSLSTVNRYVAAGADPAADYGGAINVRDREVEGADRLVPTGEFRETHLYDAGSAGDAFFATLESTVGYVNSATFRSRAAGELLFVGFNAQPQGGGTFEVEFVFATSANVTGLTFGPITGISKNGHDLLWAEYEDTEDADQLIRTPRAVHIERVYPRTNFATALGI
jgi:hypothetical protein